MDIWAVLGIEPTDDPRAVRRAYATRLKSIDRATQAEQFERLRVAYSWALARIEDESFVPVIDERRSLTTCSESSSDLPQTRSDLGLKLPNDVSPQRK